MTNNEIRNGLLQLGFNSGWVINDNQITIWENSDPIPSIEEIIDAAKLWDKNQNAEQAAKAQQRAELLERLGITEEEAKLLLG